MADSLPSVMLWEPALNMLSSNGTGTAFPAVPDRATVLASPWLTDHHFTTKSGSGTVVYTYGVGIWQSYANIDANQIDPKTPSSAWQKFYQNAFNILTGTPRLPSQTDTAQWDSFTGTTGLAVPITAVQKWMSTNATTVGKLRDSVAKTESTIQGQAADVIWQILDHFATGLTGTANQFTAGLTYLGEAAAKLQAFHEAAVVAWNKWINGTGGSLDTGVAGIQIPDSGALVSPLGCLNAVARGVKFTPGNYHRNRGILVPVPDGFGTNDIASWSFWQDVETAARNLWTAKTAQLDDPAIGTAFNEMVQKYLMGTNALRLTPPVFGQIDVTSTDKSDTTDDKNDDTDLSNLLKNLGGGNDTTTPPPTGTGGDTDLTSPPGNDTSLTPPPGTGPNTDKTTVPPPVTTPPPLDSGANGDSGYLVPDGKGGYDFKPAADFANGSVPAGAIPGTMVPGANGSSTFRPTTMPTSTTKPTDGTAGYLVPDGKGGYAFKPASDFASATDVPAGAVPGYQVPDGHGKSHFVPSGAADVTDPPPTYAPPTYQAPTYKFTPPSTVSTGPAPHPEPLTASTDSNGNLTPPPALPGPSTTDTTGTAGAGGSGTGGATGAAGAAGQSNNVPLYPPMAGGMGGMGGMGGGGQQNQDRQRTTWLAEDEAVWGTDPRLAPPVLGRANTKRTRSDEEEYDYAPFGGDRPGTAAGRPVRAARPDRGDERRSGETAGVRNV